MKKLDWYFNFIGVKSEGWKRIISSIIILFIILFIIYIITLNIKINVLVERTDISFLDKQRFIGNVKDKGYFFSYTYLLGSIIGLSFITKSITWIKEGFIKK